MRQALALARFPAVARFCAMPWAGGFAAPEWLRIAVVYGCAAALMFARGHG